MDRVAQPEQIEGPSRQRWWPATLRALLMLMLALLSLGALAACSKSEAKTEKEETSLPALRLTDETPDLLLTWIDERGDTPTGVKLSEVPEGSRSQVRVITKKAGHKQLFYVADLTQKRADGSYPVTTMTRQEWDALLAKRRAGYLAARRPPPHRAPGIPPRGTPHGRSRPGLPPGIPPHQGPEPAPKTAPDGAISAIVYGAAWCKPCHQAADYMKKRGVHVIEHDIEKTPGKDREMQDKLRRAGRSGGSIPVIDIEGTILVGFSTRAIDRAIKKAGGGGTML